MSGCLGHPAPLCRPWMPLAAALNTPVLSRDCSVSAARRPRRTHLLRGAGPTNVRRRRRPKRTSAASARLPPSAPHATAPAPRPDGLADVAISGRAVNAPTRLRPTTGRSLTRTPIEQRASLLVFGNVLGGRSTPPSLFTKSPPSRMRTTTSLARRWSNKTAPLVMLRRRTMTWSSSTTH